RARCSPSIADGTTTLSYTVSVTRTTPAPDVVTQAADNVNATGTKLHGTVNANNTSTTVSFNYGLTTAYGSSAAADETPVSGNSVTPVSAVLTGLTPSTTYHYRVSALNVGGLSNGSDATFTTPSNVATLSALTLSAGTLDPVFDSATTIYAATVDNTMESITVTPTVSNSAATVKVNTVAVTSGNASDAISLSEGANVITVVGTAEDGTTTKTYTVTVTREAPVAPAPAFAVGGAQPTPLKARLTGPAANGGVLPGANVAFTWDAGQSVSEIWLKIGSTEGGADLYDASQGSALTQNVTLPTDGSDLYVSLLSKINGSWLANNYLYAAADTSTKAVLITPADESTLTTAAAEFSWNDVAGATEYWLSIGNTSGGTDVYDASQGTALSQTVNLPTDGRELFVMLKTKLNGAWTSSSSVIFASGNGAPAAAKMISPADHSTLSGTSVTFTWDAGTGVSGYWLSVGSSATAMDLFSASQGSNQSATLTIPADGSPLYFTLSSLIDGNWRSNLYLYEAAVPQ
ncbi:MAG: cadherin-like beta sandwich domain-containing protein, partial [Verrucomicrobia bacterium]|nr:cadherin-like beta sandwich domain-containing protein [Verrucomicrobiota bacterium]